MYQKSYKEKFIIGRGNYGVASLVTEKSTNKDYVAKKISLSSLSTYELKNCQLEAKLLEGLVHPNIVNYKETIIEPGQLIIVMEYCQGGDLSQLIKSHKDSRSFFPEEQVSVWMVQLLSALKYLEEKRVIHRDIKSSNVYLTNDGNLKLGDFGIAKMLSCTSDVARTVVGTPYYMSPEVCENKPYSCKSDIWSLGCLFYELAALRHPFTGNSFLALVMSILKEEPQQLPVLYSEEFRGIVAKMLSKDAKVRSSASEILQNPYFSSICENVDYEYEVSESNSSDEVILCSNTDNFAVSSMNPMDLVNSENDVSGDWVDFSHTAIPTFTPDMEVIGSNVFKMSMCFENSQVKVKVLEEGEYEEDFESVHYI